MRNQPYHPIAGLTLVLLTGLMFWCGVILLVRALVP
jgi:hypothetical protein